MTHQHSPASTPYREDGVLIQRAIPADYPLFGRCACGALIRCADSTADWAVR